MGSFVVKATSRVQAANGGGRSALGSAVADYMDEKGKGHLDRTNEYFLPQDVRELLQDKPLPVVAEEQLPRVRVSPSFSRGRVYTEGYLMQEMSIRGLPAQSPDEPQAKATWLEGLIDVWMTLWSRHNVQDRKARRGRPQTIGVKLVFSPDPTDTLLLHARGQSMITVMQKIVPKIWKEYAVLIGQDRSALGYFWTFHLDKDHIHAHTMMMPTTKSGGGLRLSNGIREGVEGSRQRRDYLTEFQQLAERVYNEELVQMGTRRLTVSLVEQIQNGLTAKQAVSSLASLPREELKRVVIAGAVEQLKKKVPDISAEEFGPIVTRWLKNSAESQAKVEAAGRTDPQREEMIADRWWRWLGLAMEDESKKRDRGALKSLATSIANRDVRVPKPEEVGLIISKVLRAEPPDLRGLKNEWLGPTWMPLALDWLERALDQGRRVVLRALRHDAIVSRTPYEPVIRDWFNPVRLVTEEAPAKPNELPVSAGRAPWRPQRPSAPVPQFNEDR